MLNIGEVVEDEPHATVIGARAGPDRSALQPVGGLGQTLQAPQRNPDPAQRRTLQLSIEPARKMLAASRPAASASSCRHSREDSGQAQQCLTFPMSAAHPAGQLNCLASCREGLLALPVSTSPSARLASNTT